MILHMGVYLRAKFNVSSIILTSFRQGIDFYCPTSKRTLKNPPKLELNGFGLKIFRNLMKSL